MNKAYKVVFNKLRGAMIVANELTKSHQVGKKAAVMVAVAGALGISASVMAADWSANGKSVIINGNTGVTVGGADQGSIPEDSAVFGGSRNNFVGNESSFANVNTTNIVVNGNGTFEDIIGGHYAIFGSQSASENEKIKESGDLSQGNLSVEINEGTFTRNIVGGNKIARNSPNGNFEQSHVNLDENGNFKSGIVNVTTDSVNLVINGGTFGKPGDNSWKDGYGAPKKMVIGGDYVKDIGWGKVKTVSTIKDLQFTINGGTFNVPVIGGSFGNIYADFHTEMEFNVVKSTLTINGGTFNRPVIAGNAIFVSKEVYSATNPGYENNVDPCDSINRPEHVQLKTNVSDLSVTNATLTDLYTGGLVQYKEAQYVTPETVQNVVATSNVTIGPGTVVANIYGKTAYSTLQSDGTWSYSDTLQQARTARAVPTSESVNTNLRVINATITGQADIPQGTVELRSEDGGVTRVASLSTGENVRVSATANGNTNDAVCGDVNQLLSQYIIIGDGSQGSETAQAVEQVTMDAGLVTGAVTATLEDGEITSVTEAVNPTNKSISDMAINLPTMLARIEMNDLRKRMGDVASAEGDSGVWARYDGGRMYGLGLTNKFNKIQVGIDTIPSPDSMRFGLAFTYGQGDVDGTGVNADTDTYSLAAYGIWMGESGQFVDVIGRMAKMDTELSTANFKSKYDQLALSLSGEFGWKFDITNSIYVEPSVEATYSYIDGDTFDGGKATFEVDSTDSLIARAGFAAGIKCPNNRGNAYIRAGVVHEFLGDGKLTGKIGNTVRTIESDGKDTWVEYAIGANFNINKQAYVWADVERTSGAAIDEDWRATVGVRYSF